MVTTDLSANQNCVCVSPGAERGEETVRGLKGEELESDGSERSRRTSEEHQGGGGEGEGTGGGEAADHTRYYY